MLADPYLLVYTLGTTRMPMHHATTRESESHHRGACPTPPLTPNSPIKEGEGEVQGTQGGERFSEYTEVGGAGFVNRAGGRAAFIAAAAAGALGSSEVRLGLALTIPS